MFSKSTGVKAGVLAAALAVAAVGVPSASAATVTLSKASPSKSPLNVESVVTLTGKNFSSAIKTAKFAAGTAAACASTSLIVVSATTAYAYTPASGCTAGKQDVTLFDGAGTPVLLATLTANATGSNTVTFVEPQDVSAVAPLATGTTSAASTIFGGTAVKVTTTTTLPTSGISATIGGKALGAIKRIDANNFSAKVPAGLSLATSLPVIVKANGVPSAPFTATFGIKLAVKVSPNIFVQGATAPYLKIDSVGLKPATGSKQYVSVCGVDAPVLTAAVTGTQVKAPTDKTIWVQAPAFDAAGMPSTFATDGGACVIVVTVDPAGTDATSVNATTGVRTITDGDAGASPAIPADNYTSVVTGTSAMVYAAY